MPRDVLEQRGSGPGALGVRVDSERVEEVVGFVRMDGVDVFVARRPRAAAPGPDSTTPHASCTNERGGGGQRSAG
jgi:hypothetical protein